MAKSFSKLGKNIKALRKAFGVTQVELARAINVEDNTISMYETGKREPDIDKLRAVASYFNIHIDQLTKTDFSALNLSLSAFTWEKLASIYESIFPIVVSESALKDSSFVKGYEYTEELLAYIKKGEMLTESVFDRVFSGALDAYIDSLYDSKTEESAANILFLIFFLHSAQFSDEHTPKMHEKLLQREVAGTDLMKYALKIQNRAKEENELNKTPHSSGLKKITHICLQLLKGSFAYSNLADYYLVLRYYFGMVATEHEQDMNRIIGLEMIKSFSALGNTYCKNFIEKISRM